MKKWFFSLSITWNGMKKKPSWNKSLSLRNIEKIYEKRDKIYGNILITTFKIESAYFCVLQRISWFLFRTISIFFSLLRIKALLHILTSINSVGDIFFYSYIPWQLLTIGVCEVGSVGQCVRSVLDLPGFTVRYAHTMPQRCRCRSRSPSQAYRQIKPLKGISNQKNQLKVIQNECNIQQFG